MENKKAAAHAVTGLLAGRRLSMCLTSFACGCRAFVSLALLVALRKDRRFRELCPDACPSCSIGEQSRRCGGHPVHSSKRAPRLTLSLGWHCQFQMQTTLYSTSWSAWSRILTGGISFNPGCMLSRSSYQTSTDATAETRLVSKNTRTTDAWLEQCGESPAHGDCLESRKFWGLAMAVDCLSGCGVATRVWMHECQCVHHQTDQEKKVCKLKGRKSVHFACCAWRSFIASLKGLSSSPGMHTAMARLRLDAEGSGCANEVMSPFLARRTDMEFRCQQAWSFWGSLPCSILELCRHYVDDSVDESWSRNRAQELIDIYDEGNNKTSFGAVSWNFFGHDEHRRVLQRWISGKALRNDVRRLLGYATSLTVMQRLEARDHVVNLTMTRGRAVLPPAIMSGLRRRPNRPGSRMAFRGSRRSLTNRYRNSGRHGRSYWNRSMGTG